MNAPNFEQIVGRSQDHLQPCANGHLVHHDVVAPLHALREGAKLAGIDLQIASGFRSFNRQLAIWSDKVSGKRTLLGKHGERLVAASLDRRDLLHSILRWSALPGLSRHHWGTDLDVYDAAAISADYQLQLTCEEYSSAGPFHRLSEWLAANAGQAGFYRPYALDCGGVAPEPWHISYRPVAAQFERCCDFGLFERLLDESAWPLCEEIGAEAESIYRRYVCISTPDQRTLYPEDSL